MREFFQEKLQVPIEFFNPVRNVAITNEADAREIARSAYLLGEVVGLALRAVASCPMELNLRPASVVRDHEVQRRRPFLIGAAACVIAGLLGWSVFYLHAAGLLRAIKQEVVVDYFKNLVGSPFFKIDPTNQQRVIKPTMPNNNEWAFPYELQLDLKQPLPLS